MIEKSKVFTVAAAGLAACVLTGCGVGQATPAAAEPVATPVPVETAYPERRELYATYDATATIASEGDAPVVARVAGDLVEILVEEGEYVEEGQALARLDGERLRLEMLAARADLDRARSEYERNLDLNRRGLIAESMFDGLRYELDALEAAWQLKKLDYEYATIRAPIAGLVSDRFVKLGQSIARNDELFRITNTGDLVAYLTIPQAEIARFSAGNTATLSVDAMPDTRFSAEIVRLSPTIDRKNGTFRATAFIDNASGRLAPGMFARFSIEYERHADALTVPESALVVEDDKVSVYVAENDEAVLRAIDVGVRADGVVEVTGGLAENEAVVIGGQGALRDGSRILAQHVGGSRERLMHDSGRTPIAFCIAVRTFLR